MPITSRVGLACTITVSDDGTELNFIDTTGTYSATNTDGYGLPGGIASSNVTSFTLVQTWASLEQSITYTFTVGNNTISAATLTDLSGTAYNIFSQLTSTVFPFVAANPFNLVTEWTNSGIEVPAFDDGVYQLDYTITGTLSAEIFSYTTSGYTLRISDVCCCLNKMAIEIDPDCLCSSDKLMGYLRADAYLSIASNAASVGQTDNAVTLVNKAQEICDNEDCNC